jgi:hypothetical protein
VQSERVEECGDFKAFIEEYAPQSGATSLTGHTKQHRFRFSKRVDGLPIMQYKTYTTDPVWLPEEGHVMFYTSADDANVLDKMPLVTEKPLPVNILPTDFKNKASFLMPRTAN